MTATLDRPLEGRLRHARRGRRGRWWALAVLSALPIATVAVGGLAARPIADDFSVEATFQSGGSVGHAFSTWVHTWTSAYSMYALLSAGPRLERTIGTRAYYPLVSTLVLALFVIAVAFAVRGWFRGVGVPVARAPQAVCVLIVAAALLGSLTSFRHPTDPMVFGAFYWAAAWVPHLVPVLLLPAVLVGVVGSARVQSPPLRLVLIVAWAMLGVALAGFAFAETVFLAIATVTTTWAVLRLRSTRGAAKETRRVPVFAIALVTGLAVGFVVMLLLPGTSARSVDYTNHHIGLARYGSATAVARALVKTMAQDLLHTIATPALVVGAVAGFALRRLVVNVTPTDDERRSVRVIGAALVATAVGWWVAVAVGDVASYIAWWHLLSLTMLFSLCAAAAGWGCAARAVKVGERARRLAPGTVVLALAVTVLWSMVVTVTAARVAWTRKAVVDADLAAARAVREGRARPPVVWRAEPVGDIGDMAADPGNWINMAVAAWVGVPPTRFSVWQPRRPLRATFAVLSPR